MTVNNGKALDNQGFCVCCGEVIPEGRMVCWKCEGRLYWEEMYGNEQKEETK